MNVWLVWVKDPESKIITDIVAMSSYANALEIERAFQKKYSRENVSITSAMLDEWPADLLDPRSPTLHEAESGDGQVDVKKIVTRLLKCKECGHEHTPFWSNDYCHSCGALLVEADANVQGKIR